MIRIVGIDPGLSGAFCVMTIADDDRRPDITFEPMPIIGRDLDFHELCRIFASIQDAHVFLEQVNAFKMGASSAFKFGRQLGALEALLHAHRISFTQVTPQKWQGIMHSGINKKSMPLPKQRSLAVVRRLFPELNLLKTSRSKFPDDGYVDALLMAEYGRRALITSTPAKFLSTEIVGEDS